MPASAVLGWGRHLPPRVVTNADLTGPLGVGAAELEARTGIARRHHVEPGQGPSDLAREAAMAALGHAGLAPRDVDLIVFATISPDIAFPGAGCFLQARLGCDTVGAIDLRAQCAGFLFALATGDRFVRAGAAKRVLVAAGEVHSTALDYSPRGAGVTPWFGDGAGVVVLGDAAEPGVVTTVLHTDPTGIERFWCEYPASRDHPERMTLEHLRAGRHYFQLDLAALNPQAETTLAATSAETLERAGLATGDLALAIVHYIDPRVARKAAERAGLPTDRVVVPAETFGHIAAGGLPIALADAIDAGRVGRGDRVLLVAFGAGISWGGAVLRL